MMSEEVNYFEDVMKWHELSQQRELSEDEKTEFWKVADTASEHNAEILVGEFKGMGVGDLLDELAVLVDEEYERELTEEETVEYVKMVEFLKEYQINIPFGVSL